MKKYRWLILVLVLLLAGSCTYVRRPRLVNGDESRLLEYLRHSPSQDVRSSAALVLLLFDHEKYTPAVAEQIHREKTGASKIQFMSLLAQWGDEQAVPYLKPYTEQDKMVSAYSGDEVNIRYVAEEVIEKVQTPRPPRNLPREVPLW